MSKYVYIAGPYTKGDVVVNVRNAVQAAEWLVGIGYEPYVPHLTHFWHLILPHKIEFWYVRDLEWLKKCDVIVRLPGESAGADNEIMVAHGHGIPSVVLPEFNRLAMVEAMHYHEQLMGRP